MRLVWFFGPSAGGKRTAVLRVALSPEDPLRIHLGLDPPVEICTASLLAGADRNPSDVERSVSESHGPYRTRLVKCQDNDADLAVGDSLPQRMQVHHPDWPQEVVFTWASPPVLLGRWRERAASDPNPVHRSHWADVEEVDCQDDLRRQADHVGLLSLMTTWVNTDTNEYHIGELPDW